ncbi:alginate O-acetyltransferase AlgX-related protein [Nocardioides sp. CPCC 205120]|uniref:alginate O-acetyltransferase AlgX-related protein n=1 Tax=Nocardioides sp. CPCC 205120 TaxID=3406462 RepID=UPI003B512478
MSQPRRTVAALALLLVAAGCSAGDPAPDEAPDRSAAAPARTSGTTDAPADASPEAADALAADDPWGPERRAASEAAFTEAVAAAGTSYVVGEDGFHFFGDDHNLNLSQAVGRVRLDAAGAQEWATYLTDLQAQAEAGGAEFRAVIAPAKWDVHRDQLPAWARELSGETSAQVLRRLHPDLPLVDVRTVLRDAPYPTYDPLDSHWTPYGGWLAWAAVVADLAAAGVEGLELPELVDVETVPSVNELAAEGVPDAPPVRTVPVFAGEQPPSEVTGPDGALPASAGGIVALGAMPAETRTPGALGTAEVLLLRDSMLTLVSPAIVRTSPRTLQHSHGIAGTGPVPDVGALVTEERPDVVLLVLAERYLGAGPPG